MYRIVMPIDGNVDRAEAQTETAADLPCAEAEVEVTLLHVFNDSTVDKSADMVDPRRVEAVTRAEQRLNKLGVAVKAHAEVGDTATAIVQLADRTDANAICIAGPKRSPTGKAVFGSVIHDVIMNASRPVFVTITN